MKTNCKKKKKNSKCTKKTIIKCFKKNLNIKNIIIAYEPIWSIGTGQIPTVYELKTITNYIKKILKNIFKKNSPPVLYGGSVDGDNVKIFKKIRN